MSSSTTTVKDLSAYIDSEFKYHCHSNAIAVKAKRVLALIHKSFKCMDAEMFIKLYKSLVRPIV